MSTSTLATPTVVVRPLTASIRTAAIALAIVLFAVLSFAVGRSTVSTHRAPAFHPVPTVTRAGGFESVRCRVARPC